MVVESRPPVELPSHNNLSLFFELAVQRWKDKGPALGHIRPILKGDVLQHLALERLPSERAGYTAYRLDITDPFGSGRAEHVMLIYNAKTGEEKIQYASVTQFTDEKNPLYQDLDKEKEYWLKHKLISQSGWGVETTYNPYGYLDMIHVPENRVMRELGLSGTDIPHDIKESVARSQWFSIDNGRIMVEIRNPSMLDREYIAHQQNGVGVVSITDADDTLFDITKSHKKEYRLVADDARLHKRGIQISEQAAEQLYNASKITIPGKANEPRYTARLNLALLSAYAHALESHLSPQQASEKTEEVRNRVIQSSDPEKKIKTLHIDADITRIFNSNPLSHHIHLDYIRDMFTEFDKNGDRVRGEEKNVNIIATRGTIDGVLGQVHKIHQLQFKPQDSKSEVHLVDHGVDIVIYTNDLKAEVFTLIPQMFPYLLGWRTRIFDDNTKELKQYYDYARNHNLRNLELVHVRHRGSRRFNDRFVVNNPAVRSGSDQFGPPEDHGKVELPDGVSVVYESTFPFDGDEMGLELQFATGGS